MWLAEPGSDDRNATDGSSCPTYGSPGVLKASRQIDLASLSQSGSASPLAERCATGLNVRWLALAVAGAGFATPGPRTSAPQSTVRSTAARKTTREVGFLMTPPLCFPLYLPDRGVSASAAAVVNPVASNLRNHRDSGQLRPLEELQRGAAARGEPRHLVVEAELVERARRVRAADDRVGIGLRDRLGHCACAFREGRPLEDAHRAVPEDRLCAGDLGGEGLTRLGPDVEAEPAVRERVVGNDLGLGVRLEGGRGHDVPRQLDLEAERVVLAELLGHFAADEHRVGPAAEVSEDAELVLDLGASRDEHERALDLAEQLAELLELAFEQ